MGSHRTSRRSALGLLGAAPIAAGGLLAMPGFGSAGAGAAPPRRGGVPRDLRPRGALDRLIAELAAADHFSGTVLVKHRNDVVLSRSHGMANKDTGVRNRPDTIYAHGSITKLFTSVAVAQLVQAGDLAYHEKLGTYLDGFQPDVAENVTVHQLVTHTSGMGDFHGDAYDTESLTWDSAREVMDGTMQWVRNLEVEYRPRPQYSNSGYVTLGAIVEAVSGQTYHDYVRDHVFDAAGMASAAFYTKPERARDPNIARSYATLPTGERADSIDEQAYIGLPAGGSYASAEDLVSFTRALRGDDLLDAPYTHILLTPKVPGSSDRGYPSFGTYASVASYIGDQWTFGAHGGSTEGVSADLNWYPDADLEVVVLSNYQDATDDITERAREIITGP